LPDNANEGPGISNWAKTKEKRNRGMTAEKGKTGELKKKISRTDHKSEERALSKGGNSSGHRLGGRVFGGESVNLNEGNKKETPICKEGKEQTPAGSEGGEN